MVRSIRRARDRLPALYAAAKKNGMGSRSTPRITAHRGATAALYAREDRRALFPDSRPVEREVVAVRQACSMPRSPARGSTWCISHQARAVAELAAAKRRGVTIYGETPRCIPVSTGPTSSATTPRCGGDSRHCASTTTSTRSGRRSRPRSRYRRYGHIPIRPRRQDGAGSRVRKIPPWVSNLETLLPSSIQKGAEEPDHGRTYRGSPGDDAARHRAASETKGEIAVGRMPTWCSSIPSARARSTAARCTPPRLRPY